MQPVRRAVRLGILLLSLSPLTLLAQASATVERDTAGMVIHNGSETIHIAVCGPDLIHVVAGPGNPTGASPHTPWIVTPCTPDHFDFESDAKSGTVSTTKLRVQVDLKTVTLRFIDASGAVLLHEFAGREPRAYVATEANGEKVYRVTERFFPDALEGIYGLGQHQAGVFNYRGAVVELALANTDVAIPFLVSTKGYGLLWNTASRSWFDDRFLNEMKLVAEAADAIDYYFVYGPEMDQTIHQQIRHHRQPP